MSGERSQLEVQQIDEVLAQFLAQREGLSWDELPEEMKNVFRGCFEKEGESGVSGLFS